MKKLLLVFLLSGCGENQAVKSSAEVDGKPTKTAPTITASGENGKDGAPGAQGPAGPKGENGKDGAPGAAGANGADGAQGAAGADGKDGAAGAQGAAGVDGAPGLAGSPGLGSIWTDPDTGSQWVYTAISVQYSSAVCPTGFVMVSHADVLPTKFQAYLTVFESTLKTNAAFWTSGTSGGGRYTGTVSTGGASQVLDGAPASSLHAVVCKQ